MSPLGHHFRPYSTVKPMIKAQIRKESSIGISDIVTASVYSEKPRLKKLMMIIGRGSEPHTEVFNRNFA